MSGLKQKLRIQNRSFKAFLGSSWKANFSAYVTLLPIFWYRSVATFPSYPSPQLTLSQTSTSWTSRDTVDHCATASQTTTQESSLELSIGTMMNVQETVPIYMAVVVDGGTLSASWLLPMANTNIPMNLYTRKVLIGFAEKDSTTRIRKQRFSFRSITYPSYHMTKLYSAI